METDSPVVYHGTTESRFPPGETNRGRQFQLTKEETRALRECNKESFYYRCLPLSLAGMAGTYLAVQNGILKAHPRWGAAGKMAGACLIGYVLGKLSYKTACEDKFLKLENSTIGDIVRKKRGYVTERFESESKIREDDFIPKDSNYSSFGKDDYYSSSGSLNLDMDKNIQYSGLDDRERPSTDREGLLGDVNEPVQKITTYDELRRRNREEYENKLQRPPPRSDTYLPKGTRRPLGDHESQPVGSFGGSQPSGGVKNVYGDSWDNPKFT